MSAYLHEGKSRIRDCFAAAADSYDSVAGLQRQIGLELLNQSRLGVSSGTTVDLGCGTGFLTAQLQQAADWERVLAIDIALPMLLKARAKLGTGTIGYICADAEQLPLQNQTVERLFSNLVLQWCPNLSAVFGELYRILQPGGQLSFALFAANTLHELKTSWAQVDPYKHVIDFYHAGQIYELLETAGFKDIELTTRSYVVYYPSPLLLMKGLKQLGARHVPGRNPYLTGKAGFQRMINAYEHLRTPEGIPATFEAIMVQAHR